MTTDPRARVLRVVRTPPAAPCVGPDGHVAEDEAVRGAAVPAVVLCPRCGLRWDVAVVPEEGQSPAAAEALAAMPAMFAALREARTLDDDDPRRVAALAEKRRVLDLIAAAEVPR